MNGDQNPSSQTGDHRFAFLSWKPESANVKNPTPVTLFNGFLGAGKTTLLKHLLKQHPETSIALIINDVGEVNLDAVEVRHDLEGRGEQIQMIQELTQGCICCSIGDELADALVYLQEEKQPDEIWIEASGVSNPRNILPTFYMQNIKGHILDEAFSIKNIVTVVDAGLFYREWNLTERTTSRERIHLHDPQSPYIELVIDQLETCDVIVINKVDQLTPEQLQNVDAILDALNPRAQRFSCTEGALESKLLLGPARFELQPTQRGSTVYRHLEQLPEHKLDAEHPHIHAHHHGTHQHPYNTVFFQARQPVNEEAFFHTLKEELPNVVRAKGFYYTSAHPNRCGIVSLAGGILRADGAGPWFVDLLQSGKVQASEMPPEVEAAWYPLPQGDRRQELVLIGLALDKAHIHKLLSACLESDPHTEYPCT